MIKEEYLALAEKLFDGEAKKLMLAQIDEFFELSSRKIRNQKYKIGDIVRLKKGTYMHGFRGGMDVVDIFAKNGVITRDFELGSKNRLTNYTISLWHIRKDVDLYEYIHVHSGMTVTYDHFVKDKSGNYVFENITKIVPYGELDSFVDSMKDVSFVKWTAENTFESRFLPCEARNDNQIAFIINGRAKEVQSYVSRDLLNYDIDIDTTLKFMCFKDAKQKEEFEKDKQNGYNKRVAYWMFGIPVTLIEGIFVGRKYEKDKAILSHIKSKFPDCYICNLDGKVIVE